jgi:hypothetical protein
MVLELAAPCVQHGDNADLGTEMISIAGNGDQGLGGSLE